MKIELWTIGKTKDKYILQGISEFEARLKHYTRFSNVEIPAIKVSSNTSPAELKLKESQSILPKLKGQDWLILLDEKGKSFTSVGFGAYLEKLMNQSKRRVIFLVGGAYGFDKSLYQRANQNISLSPMTFSHQMVRLIFVEQLYRAFTIIKNEKYHNT